MYNLCDFGELISAHCGISTVGLGNFDGKVEKILKGSLDSIPSPSSLVKIQIMGKKFN